MTELKNFLKEQNCEENLQKVLLLIAQGVVNVRALIAKGSNNEAGSKNSSGENQLALDIQANNVLTELFKNSGLVSAIASEEIDNAEKFSAQEGLVIVFDPLDGSSLVGVNLSVGSIFGIYEAGELIGRRGDEQLASAYAVYGPQTTFMLTFKDGTHEFCLEDGKFMLLRENLNVKEDSKYFAPGNLRAAAKRKDYLGVVADFIINSYTLRYSGGMVPDINHIIVKENGIFMYPSYEDQPKGKLRLLFECAPMALLMEQAGGAASDGTGRILEIPLKEIHERTPIFIGSTNEVVKVCAKLINI